MPFRIRSKNPLIRVFSAVTSALAWWAVMATILLIVIPFFGTFDTQAFLTGTKPVNDFKISDFEFILILAIMISANLSFSLLFKRLTRYASRKLKRNVEWETNSIG